LEMRDTSFGYKEREEGWSLRWRRRADSGFCRVGAHNYSTREALGAQAAFLNSMDLDLEGGEEDEEEEGQRFVTDEEAAAAGAAVMLQVVRLFDDPSLESELGLRP